MKGFKGYVSSRFDDGFFTHQRIQNLVIREYIKKIGKSFLLSATEYYMNNSYLMLKYLMEDMDSFDGVVFYSTHLLPKEKVFRTAILSKFLVSCKEVHFALEEIGLCKLEDMGIIEDIFIARELSLKVNTQAIKEYL